MPSVNEEHVAQKWNRDWRAEKINLFAIMRDQTFTSNWSMDALVDKLCDLLRHIIQPRGLSKDNMGAPQPPPYDSYMATYFLTGMVCCVLLDLLSF